MNPDPNYRQWHDPTSAPPQSGPPYGAPPPRHSARHFDFLRHARRHAQRAWGSQSAPIDAHYAAVASGLRSANRVSGQLTV